MLYLEIIRKLLEKDKGRHLTDHSIFEIYRRMSERYGDEAQAGGGDFSERLLRLSKRISKWFQDDHGGENVTRLSTNEITNFLYQTDIHQLEGGYCSVSSV